MIYFINNLLLYFFSSIWCFWLSCAFLLFLTGNIFQYSRINSIGGNFLFLYTNTSRKEIHFSRVVIVYWVITDHVKKLPTTFYVPPFCFNHIWRQTRSLNKQIQANGSINLNSLTTSKYILDIHLKNTLMTLGNICSWDWEG